MTTKHTDGILERRPATAPWRGAALALSTAAALLAGLAAWPGTAAATTLTMGTGLPATPEPSFTPHVVAPTNTGFAAGRLRVALHVKPGCAVALPHSGELTKVRLQCSDGAVWLGNLVPQRSPEPMAGRRHATFVPLRFERQADGFRPYPEEQGAADAPMLVPQSGIRFNLDY
ncbi:MAG: hypothetical protein EOP71_04715 [Variovorax sp.]|nr:MAG: hypothetical protein EOP71_04715 [Variovorax sp.]